LQAIDRIDPNKLDSRNKKKPKPTLEMHRLPIWDLGLREGTNWLLEHQFQTHPNDPIFIFMLIYRWSQDEQKHLVPKLLVTMTTLALKKQARN
jgi:hypothetical protein